MGIDIHIMDTLIDSKEKGGRYVLRKLPIWRMAFSLGIPPRDGLPRDGKLGLPICRDGADALFPAMGGIWIS